MQPTTIGLDLAKMVCSQRTNSACPGEAGWFGRSAERGRGLTARRPRPAAPFRGDHILSERAMKRQQWTVRRRPVGRPAAQRRWDRAYQLLLQAPAAPAALPALPAAPRDATEESRHADSRVCPGLEPAPGPGADH